MTRDCVVMTEDSHNDAGLVLVLSGSLKLSQHEEDLSGNHRLDHSNPEERVLYVAKKVFQNNLILSYKKENIIKFLFLLG